jgi:hypothetical protein
MIEGSAPLIESSFSFVSFIDLPWYPAVHHALFPLYSFHVGIL